MMLQQSKPHNRTILVGDVFERLNQFPDNSVDVIITSPPYYGVRDYGEAGQWGLEPDYRIYIAKMQVLIDKLKKVLKKTGTFWLNIGDSYGGSTMHADWTSIDPGFSCKRFTDGGFKTRITKPFPKSLMGIPSRLFTYCIDTDWKARNFIPWEKGNPMPSSVADRFNNVWEPVFFFAKSEKYYSNLDAVREPFKTKYQPFNVRVRDTKKPKFLQKATKKEIKSHNKRGVPKKQDHVVGPDGKPKSHYKGFNHRWKYGPQFRNQRGLVGHSGVTKPDGSPIGNPKGKNPGDVFHINVRPFKGAHFATFPYDLPEKIIKFACPKNGIILDPFFGAGTVGLAAEKLGRKWVGIELKKEYADLAIKRIGSGKIV